MNDSDSSNYKFEEEKDSFENNKHNVIRLQKFILKLLQIFLDINIFQVIKNNAHLINESNESPL